MSEERYSQRKEQFLKALKTLKEALEAEPTQLNKDGTIQRFEYTYELAWKVMKLWLAEKNIDARNSKEVFKESLEQGLIEDGNIWSDMLENRNLTTHTYDDTMAEKVYEFIKKMVVEQFDILAKKL